MPGEGDICPKCGKPRKQTKSGSLTQWVSVCKCNVIADDDFEAFKVSICLDCGKRIGGGRSGTFTQWIFRTDICSCDTPRPSESTVKLNESGSKYLLDSNVTVENEIEVSDTDFPLDRFAPIKLVNSNENGSVYLCIDRFLGNQVAVKCATLINDYDVIRFQKEATALSKLSHPGIVKVLDFASVNNSLYMVMEFVEGITLGSYLARNKKLKYSKAITIINQLCEILKYCHDKSIFHRDIKPDNIILLAGSDLSNQLKLLDFGIACLHEDTKQGQTLAGTPKYMAPDVANGSTYDSRSEIYSIGCLFFQLLEGRVPFEDTSQIGLLRKHAEDAIPRLEAETKDQEVRNFLQSIIDKCLAKNPDDRFQSIEELVSAINSSSQAVSPQVTISTDSTESVELDKIGPKRIVYMVLFLLLPIGILVSSLFQPPQKAEKKDRKFDQVKKIDDKNVKAQAENILSTVSTSSQKLSFENDELNDQILYKVGSRANRLKEITLYKCTDISVQGLKKFFSVCQPRTMELIGTASISNLVGSLESNSRLTDLRLVEANSESLVMIPTESIKSLTLTRMTIEDSGLEHLKDFDKLVALRFIDCSFSKGVFPKLAQLKNTSLALEHGSISSSDISNLVEFKNLKRLELTAFAVSGTNYQLERKVVKDDIGETIAGFEKGLWTKATVELIDSVSNLSIKNLFLRDYVIDIDAVNALKKMRQLKFLELRKCIIEPGAKSILELSLPNCRVSFKDSGEDYNRKYFK